MTLSNGAKLAIGVAALWGGFLVSLLASGTKRLARNPREEDETSFRFLTKAYGRIDKPARTRTREEIREDIWRSTGEYFQTYSEKVDAAFMDELIRAARDRYAGHPKKFRKLKRAIMERRVYFGDDVKDILSGKYIADRRVVGLQGQYPFPSLAFVDGFPVAVREFHILPPPHPPMRIKDVTGHRKVIRDFIRKRYGDAYGILGEYTYLPGLPGDEHAAYIERAKSTGMLSDRKRARKILDALAAQKGDPLPAFPGAQPSVAALLRAGMKPTEIFHKLPKKEAVKAVNLGYEGYDDLLREAFASAGMDFSDHIVPSDLYPWIARKHLDGGQELRELTPEFSFGGQELERIPYLTLVGAFETPTGNEPIGKLARSATRAREQKFVEFVEQLKEKSEPLFPLTPELEDLPRGVKLLRSEFDYLREADKMGHCIAQHVGFTGLGTRAFHLTTGHGPDTTLEISKSGEVLDHKARFNKEADIWARAKANLLLKKLGHKRHYLKNARSRRRRRRR